MTTETSSSPGADAVIRDWQAVRADSDIQYAPIPTPEPPKPPQWLEHLLDFLREVMKPVGEWFGGAWPVMKWGLAALCVLLALYLLWNLLAPLAGWKRKAKASAEAWAPDRETALALLDDADALAAQGRFDEATHLLLQRSVGQIRQARPEWLDPSSTAREIAALPALPERARAAFATIAERVERSLFALRSLGADDWQAARHAYADFALADLRTNAG